MLLDFVVVITIYYIKRKNNLRPNKQIIIDLKFTEVKT